MAKVPVFVGLDYSSLAVQVCVLDAQGRQVVNTACANDWQVIAPLVLRHGEPQGVAIEAGTGAAHLADELRQQAGWPVQMAHPGFVRRMKVNRDKTDYADSRILADLERVGYLPPVWLAPEALRELRRLVRYRQTLVTQRTAAKLRIRALLRDHRIKLPGRAWTVAWLAGLAQVQLPAISARLLERYQQTARLLAREIRHTEQWLAEVVADDPLVRRLRQLRGIGLVTACVLRAEIGDFGRFRTGKQLARYCGLTPRNASSGNRMADAGLIAAGNSLLREVLIEAAHRLLRLDPRWRSFRDRMDRAGKPRCVTAAAAANRWVRWLFYEIQRPAA
jgi:transposase